MANVFDYIGAKKAGLTDGEIAVELATQTGYDYNGAKQAGIADSDIISEMSNRVSFGERADTITDKAGRLVSKAKKLLGAAQSTQPIPITNFAVQGRTPQPLYQPAARPANITEAVATDTNPLAPFTVKTYRDNPARFPAKPWDMDTFIKKDVPNIVMSAPSNAMTGLAKTVGGAQQFLGEDTTDEGTVYGQDAVRSMFGKFGDPKALSEAGRSLASGALITEDEKRAEYPVDTYGGKTLQGAVTSILQQGPSLALTLAGQPAAGLALMGFQDAASTYAEDRAKGRRPSDAAANAAVHLITEPGTEMLPFAKLAKGIKGGFDTKILKGYFLSEQAGESLATSVENSFDVAFNESDTDKRAEKAIDYLKSKKHRDDQEDTFWTTLFQSGIMSAGGATANKLMNSTKQAAPTPQPVTDPDLIAQLNAEVPPVPEFKSNDVPADPNRIKFELDMVKRSNDTTSEFNKTAMLLPPEVTSQEAKKLAAESGLKPIKIGDEIYIFNPKQITSTALRQYVESGNNGIPLGYGTGKIPEGGVPYAIDIDGNGTVDTQAMKDMKDTGNLGFGGMAPDPEKAVEAIQHHGRTDQDIQGNATLSPELLRLISNKNKLGKMILDDKGNIKPNVRPQLVENYNKLSETITALTPQPAVQTEPVNPYTTQEEDIFSDEYMNRQREDVEPVQQEQTGELDPLMEWIQTLPVEKRKVAMRRLNERGGMAILNKQFLAANPEFAQPGQETPEYPDLPTTAPNAYTGELPTAPNQNATPTYRGQAAPVPMPERGNRAQGMIDGVRKETQVDVSPGQKAAMEEYNKRVAADEARVYELQRLKNVGKEAIPGLRFQDHEEAGRVYEYYKSGKLKDSEWQSYVDELGTSGKIKDYVKAPQTTQELPPNKVEIPVSNNDKPPTGHYTSPSREFISSPEGQHALQSRGSRIAMLHALNDSQNNPYSRSQIDNTSDDHIDGVRDWLIKQQLPSASQKQTPADVPSAQPVTAPSEMAVTDQPVTVQPADWSGDKAIPAKPLEDLTDEEIAVLPSVKTDHPVLAALKETPVAQKPAEADKTTPQEVVAEAVKVAKPKAKNAGPRNLKTDIKRQGGINPESLHKLIDPNITKSAQWMSVKNKSGVGLDQMASQMADAGWQVPRDLNGEPDVQAFADMLVNAHSGTAPIHPDDANLFADKESQNAYNSLENVSDEEIEFHNLTESEVESAQSILSEITTDLFDALDNVEYDFIQKRIQEVQGEIESIERKIAGQLEGIDEGKQTESAGARQRQIEESVQPEKRVTSDKLFATPPTFGKKPQPKNTSDVSTSSLMDSFTSIDSVQSKLFSNPQLNPSEIAASLSGLARNIKQDIPKLIELGKQIFSAGATAYKDFTSRMKEYLGNKWTAFKAKMPNVFYKVRKILKDERGIVGKDVNSVSSGIQSDKITVSKNTDIVLNKLADKLNIELELVEVTGENSKTIKKIADVFGLRILYFTGRKSGRNQESNNNSAPNGFVNSSNKKVIYLNAESDKHLYFILGHELSHSMGLNSPAEYARLLESLRPFIDTNKYSDFEKRFDAADGMNSQDVYKEFTGDLFGRLFVDGNFWNTLAKEEPTLFRRITDKVLNLLLKAKSVFITNTATEALTDFASVSRLITESIKVYAKENNPTPLMRAVLRQPTTEDSSITQFSKAASRYDEYLDKAEAALDAENIEDALEWLAKAAELEKNYQNAPVQNMNEPPKAKPVQAQPEGDTTSSKLARRTEAAAIEAQLTAGFGDLPQSATMNMKEQAERAIEIMDNGYKTAIKMAMGTEPTPDGVRLATMYKAVEMRAYNENDVDTLYQLAMNSTIPTRLKEMGQEIKAADSGLVISPLEDARDIADIRKETAQKTGSKAQAEEIARLKEQLDDVNAKLEAKYADLAVKKMKKETDKKERPANREAKKAVLQAERQDILKKLNAKFGRVSANPMFDPETISLMLSLARNSIEMGINTAAGVIDSVHSDMSKIIKKVTKRDIRDALSNYGIEREMSKDKIDVELRELKRQWLIISKIEDAKSGKLPEKTGMKHDPKSDELRQMEKELHQIMKANGLDVQQSPEHHMKTALDAAKTRLKNEIADLDRQIAAKKRDPVRKTGIKYDADTMKLVAERNAKRTILDSLDAKPGRTAERTIEIAINSIERSIENYKRQLATNDFTRKEQATPVETPEIKRLRDVRDGLKKRRDEKKALFDEMKKSGVSDEDPRITELNRFMTETEKRIKAKETALEKAIEYRKNLIEHKILQPVKKQSATPSTPNIDRAQATLDELNKQYEQMKKDTLPPKDPEAIRLKSLKTRLTNETARLEKKLEDGDFAKPEAREQIKLDDEGAKIKKERDRIKDAYQAAVNASGKVTKEEVAELLRLSKSAEDAKADMEQGGDRLEYGKAQHKYYEYVDHLKGLNAPLKELTSNFIKEIKNTWQTNKARAIADTFTGTLKTVSDTSIAAVGSFDNSFGFRQGLVTLMTHPSAWLPGEKQSFFDFYNTLKGHDSRADRMADMLSRPHYLNGAYLTAGIVTGREEQFPTSIPGRAPVIGRAFNASENAFTGAALNMRMDLFDLLYSKAKENGVDVTDKVFLQDMGTLINSMTAKGKWGKTGAPKVVKLLLWAPNMLKAHYDVLTAHSGTAFISHPFVKKQAAYNMLKVIGETALIMLLANAFWPGSAEDDPRSTDFGKIKIGDTRFDLTGGKASLVTLAARIIRNSKKDTESGLVTKYGTGFGQKTLLDALLDFVVNKTTPPVGVVASWLRGRNRDGSPFTWGKATYGVFTPISIQNSTKLKDDHEADTIAGSLLDFIGVNANTYSDTDTQRRSIVNRIRDGKPLTEAQQKEYNKMPVSKKLDIQKESQTNPLVVKLRRLPLAQLADSVELSPDDIKQRIIYEFRVKLGRAKDVPPEDMERYRKILRENTRTQ